MSQWQQTTLGEVCEFRRGLTYKKADEVPFSINGVLRANNVDRITGKIDLTEIRYIKEDIEIPPEKWIIEGTLLICTASGSKKHLGKTALITSDLKFAFGGFMGLLVPNALLDSRYLYYFTRFQEYWQFINQLSDGANINNLKWSQLSELQLPLPSLSEQERIVSVLDEASDSVQGLRDGLLSKLAGLEELKQSVLEKAFSGELTDPVLEEAGV